jgi:hypothetical protein
MRFIANLAGISSIPIYWIVLARLFSGLFLALHQLLEFWGVKSYLLAPAGWFVIVPVSVTLSIWFGHTTCRFLLRRWSTAAQ